MVLQWHSVSLAWRFISTWKRIYLLKAFQFLFFWRRVFFRSLTFYLFLNWFSTRRSDNRKYIWRCRLYACINIKKFTWASIPENYIIARDQKSDLHATLFQSSPKINYMLITRPFAYNECLQHLAIVLIWSNQGNKWICGKVVKNTQLFFLWAAHCGKRTLKAEYYWNQRLKMLFKENNGRFASYNRS